MPSSHLEPRYSVTGQQYSESRQLLPCRNAHNTPSRTQLRVRSNQKRSEQLPSLAVPPGPDGLTARQFRAIPLGIIVRIFKLILRCENLPKHLAISRTIFIPRILRLLCLENSDLSPSPLSLLGSYIRYWHKG